MSLKTIYLVKGSTGDYEDTYRWNAKGYTDKHKAEEYCKKLNDIAQKSHKTLLIILERPRIETTLECSKFKMPLLKN